MDYGTNYITFYRSRFQFIIVFLAFMLLGAYVFGITTGTRQVASVFGIILLFITLFSYLYYLTYNPVVEFAGDAVEIKEIHHPILQWRFFYKTHTLRYLAISRVEIKNSKSGRPKNIKIQYADGSKIREIYLRKSDVSEFDNFVKLLLDKSPHIKPNYIT